MADDPPRLFLWVQHLLGIGHAMRGAAIARAGAEAGWEVDLIFGGPPVAGLNTGSARVHHLPPVLTADANFSGLVRPDGQPVDEPYRAHRRTALLDLFTAARPDVLVTEHYPFGRRQLRFELDPLLTRAAEMSPRPLVVASLRDILVRRRPEREAETAELVRRRYDHVLVHGDPALIDLGASFPPAAAIAAQTRYTGYVSGAPVTPRSRTGGPIVVSAGGSGVGGALAKTALAAAREDPGRRWHVLIGAGLPQAAFETLLRTAPANASVERARPDFRHLLAGAAASVSQAGYNTVVDLLVTATPAVLVPFAAGSETEQTLRARRMAETGRAVTVAEADLNPARLLDAVDRALTLPPQGPTPRLNGETETVRLLRGWLDDRMSNRGSEQTSSGKIDGRP